jgi:hypothetical protein
MGKWWSQRCCIQKNMMCIHVYCQLYPLLCHVSKVHPIWNDDPSWPRGRMKIARNGSESWFSCNDPFRGQC